MNALANLFSEKQSYWLDYIQRSLMTSGTLKKMIQEDGLRGMTSNPTIFHKAISTGTEYDAAIKKAAKPGRTSEEIFEEIAIYDIQKAADAFAPVYKSSKGLDGYVSIEVNPMLAYDSKGTAEEAKRLFKRVNRPNVMIKIPGTEQGLPAIQEATALGINVNITLLFSVENYKQVLNAYYKGLEQRVKKGLPIKKINSVASFFVSRVDSAINKQLDQIVAEGGGNAELANRLLHKTAIGNARVAYAYYEESIQSARFKKLLKKGANPQRLLWASTGTKDKRLSDVVYIDELIGPDTVNTMPPHTAEAFKDHGKLKCTIRKDLDVARESLKLLASINVDLDKVTDKLQADGVKSFEKSFADLMQVVGAKREQLVNQPAKRLQFNLGSHKSSYQTALEQIEQDNWVPRIWAKDASLWKTSEDHQKIIQNSLGWLRVPNHVLAHVPLLKKLAADIRKERFTHILLLGMGGSSLCPEVLRLTFGRKPGSPDFSILDSTEPGSVLERGKRSNPKKTLYIVASKSGTTTEPNAFFSYFFNEVKKVKGKKAGDNFIAITDPGTKMEEIARNKKFRHIILNPADIGGRYSALSFFGMVPAALMGIDVSSLLNNARQMADACSPSMPLAKNPGVLLGAAIGSLANAGRNKVTFFLSKELGSLGTWLEQLIAESTGKEGKGILPIESEEIQSPAYYGSDRTFVAIRTKKDKDKKLTQKLAALQKAGHPVIQVNVDSKNDIAGQFFLWEFATAVAGGLMDINPFDQPNVQEAKDLTRQFLEQFKQDRRFEKGTPIFKGKNVSVYTSNGQRNADSLVDAVSSFIDEVNAGDYVALLAYITRNEKHQSHLQSIRDFILKGKRVATTVGFGPRFLHSTGQLHKGGSNEGVFISITADDKKDIPIPGEPFSYSILKEAQARGDWAALKNKSRRALHFHFHDADKGLQELKKVFSRLSTNSFI